MSSSGRRADTIRYNVVRCLSTWLQPCVLRAIHHAAWDDDGQHYTRLDDRNPSLSDAYRSHYTNLAPLRKKGRSTHTIIPFAGHESCDGDEIVTATVVGNPIIIDLDSDDLPSFNTRSRKRPAAELTIFFAN